MLNGFEQVAIVNLIEDYNKKDYAFALYKEEWELLNKEDIRNNKAYVVVNAGGKDRKVLGIVKELRPVEKYNKPVTAQVVGVVNMDAYNERVAEENRLNEIKEKRNSILERFEKQIKKEFKNGVNKFGLSEYCSFVAKQYQDNTEMDNLVKEIAELENSI